MQINGAILYKKKSVKEMLMMIKDCLKIKQMLMLKKERKCQN